jgi:NAD-dependent SIR2 family protein deacetylase
MEKLNSLNQLINAIKTKEMAIFAGAGVSMVPPSCLPSWNMLKSNVVRSLIDSIEDNDFLKNNNISLKDNLNEYEISPELVFETIDDSDPFSAKRAIIDSLLKVNPNSVHKLLGLLAKHHFLRIIVTTNFDTLIEDVLNASIEDQEGKLLTRM